MLHVKHNLSEPDKLRIRKSQIVPNPHLDSNDIDKSTYTIELLKLNCLRLIREGESIIDEGFKIIQELINYPQALNMFLELEFYCLSNQYLFPYINLRKQFFQNYL